MRLRLRGATAPTHVPFVSPEVAPTTPAASKRALALCFAPLLLLGALSACAAVARHGSPKTRTILYAPIPVSALNQTPTGTRTCQAANAFLARVLGNRTTVASATVLGDHSMRSTARAGAWSVLCDTSDGNYLLLMNVKTRQVYAVNHVEDTNFSMDYRSEEDKDNVEGAMREKSRAVMSRDAARGQALHYLRLVGVPAQNLKAAPDIDTVLTRFGKPADSRVYNFAFTDARHPARAIVVAVNSKDGRLQSLWRPTQAI